MTCKINKNYIFVLEIITNQEWMNKLVYIIIKWSKNKTKKNKKRGSSFVVIFCEIKNKYSNNDCLMREKHTFSPGRGIGGRGSSGGLVVWPSDMNAGSSNKEISFLNWRK